jgi:transposase
MTNYREILRLRSLGLNNSQIAQSSGISRPTVIAAVQRATVLGLDWRAAENLSDKELAEKLFPDGGVKAGYKMPNYEQVHRELARSGVTQELLWMEYSEKCRLVGETPYQLTQFKTHYRAYVAKTKATMHIQRKPGELMEVDWAGQTAHLVDPDTGEVLDAYVFVAALPYSGYAYA